MSTIHRGGIIYSVPADYWQLGDWGTHALVHERAKRGEAITPEVLHECAAQAMREHEAFLQSNAETRAKYAKEEKNR